MAGRARVQLGVRLAGGRATSDAGLVGELPLRGLGIPYLNCETLLRIVVTRRRLVGPCHVGRSGPVALLARHVDLGPGGIVAILRGRVPLAQSRRVATRAAVVPVLARPG